MYLILTFSGNEVFVVWVWVSVSSLNCQFQKAGSVSDLLKNKSTGARDLTQQHEHLPGKHKAVSLSLGTKKKKSSHSLGTLGWSGNRILLGFLIYSGSRVS